MYTFKDKELTEEQIAKFAEEKGVDVATFLANNPEVKGKKQPTTQEDAEIVDVTNASQKNMESPLEPGSSGFTEEGEIILSGKEIEEDLFAVEPVQLEEVVVTVGEYKKLEREEENKAALEIFKSLGIPEMQEKDLGGIKSITEFEETQRLSKTKIEERKRRRKLLDKDISAGQSIINTGLNALNQLAGFDDRARYLANFIGSREDLIRNIFPKDKADSILKNSLIGLGKATADIDELNSMVRQTVGFTDLPDKELKNVAAYGLAATLNAATSFATSAAISVGTLGVGLASEMISQSVKDFNETKANSLGLSLEQLYTSGQAESLIPIANGVLGYSLEKAGIKGVTKYINSMSSKSAKGLFSLLNVGNKEGLTEWLQLGIETFNTSLASQDKDPALAAWNTMNSKEGLELYLQGVVGGSGVSLGGSALKSASNIRTYAEGQRLSADLSKLTELENSKYRKNISKDQINSINLAQEQIKEKIKQTFDKNNNLVAVLSEDQLSDLNTNTERISNIDKQINQTISDDSLSDSEKTILIESLNEVKQESKQKVMDIRSQAEKLASNITKAKEASKDIAGLEFKDFANAKEIQEFLKDQGQDIDSKASGQQGFIIQDKNTGKQTIVINREQAAKEKAMNIAGHELGHAVLFNTINSSPDTAINLGEALINELNKIDSNKIKDSNFKKRMELYASESKEVQMEEALTLFSDALSTGDLKFEENISTKLGDLVRKILQKFGLNIKFNTGRDVYNFIKDYNKSLEKGKLSKSQLSLASKGAKGELVADKVKTDEQIVKESRSEEASAKVQELYDTQGEAAAFDIIEQFKPITSRIVEKRSQAPNFDRQLLTDEIETGKRGILDLIREYDPKSEVPLAAYINKFLPARAIEASKRILGEEFTDDVTEARGVAAEEVSMAEAPTEKQATSKLRRVLGIKQDDEIYNLAKKVSEDIMTGELPGKKVKTAVNREARKSELRKAVSDIIGTEKAIDEQFLNKNILEILKALPASDLVKLEREAKVKVLAEQGPRLNVKDAREAVNKGLLPKDTNLQSGPKVSSKLPTTLEQAKEFFTQKRKQGLVNVITEMLVKDAAPEVTEGKMEPAKRAKVLSEIDRLPTLKFSLTTEQKNKLDDLENAINNITEGPGKDAVFENLKEEFLTFTTQKDLDFKDLQGIVDVALEDEVVAGKEGAKFTKETDNLSYYDLADKNKLKFDLKNTESLKKVGKKRLKPVNTADVNEFIGHALTLAEAIPTEGKILLGRRKTFIPGALLGYHTRTTGDGKLDDFYKALNKNIDAKWITPKTKELLDKVKTIIPASSFRNIQKKIGEASSKKEKIAIAKKALPDLIKHQESSLNFFNAFNSLLTDYLYDSKNQKEFESRLDYVLKLKRANSDNVKGERDLVILDGFYLGKPNGPIKLEHVKSSSQQSVQSLKSIVSGQWDTSIPNDFKGMFGYKNDFDEIDAYGKTNTSQYYRFYNKNIASNYILSEFGFDGTIYDKNLINAVEADLIKLKQKAAVSNNNKLPELVKFSKNSDYTNNMVLDRMAEIDDTSQEVELKFSKSLDLDKDFNDIIENKTGIASDKTYARVKAEVAGANKGRFNFFIPPSAEDFVGLLYSTLGKGDVGTAQMAWYKAHLLNPFARAMENLANDRVSMMQDYRGLKKALKIVPKDLRKKIKDSNFTKEQAVRVAIWDKQGMSVPGLSQKDQKELVDYVNADAELTVFAEQLIDINKGDEYVSPDAGWVAGTIDTDFIKALNTTKRSKYLETWQQNADVIFSEANLNKLEAAYGKPYRVALENMLYRMKTGRNRSFGTDTITSRFTDWLTNSVGAIMFFNTRSAVLQTISAVNFINFTDNNVLKAGQAFANQPQYWSDFKKLFNSPFLLDRRSGIKLNVNEADIAEMAKGPGNSARNVVAGLLKLGFLPTQIADSFAIASGGATFYRNRIKALKKEGLTEAEAEEIAFRDFREIAEESQQSSRPDKISQQQAGPLGRIVLAFANTPAQYARLIKKAASDLKNGRGDAKTNISKIIYYGVAQNLLFSALQQALFAIGFGDEDEEEEKRNEKYFNIANGMADSILRGIGVGGAVVSVVKNTAIRLAKEADKKAPKYQDAVVKGVLQISPPVSSKVGKLQSAGRSFSWNQEEMKTMGWSIDNPAYLASAQVISAITNVPLDRAIKKITNIKDAGDENIEYYKRVALALGWSAWELGIKKDSKGKVKKVEPKTDMDKLYDLNKKQQIDSLLSLGLSKKQIKALKLEEDRVKAILDPKSVKTIKVSKRDSLFGLNKKDQVKALEKLGLTKKEIRALRLESDRVEAIINKQKQEN